MYFNKRAKVTSAHYKHRVIFTLDCNHRDIVTLDDPIKSVHIVESAVTIRKNVKNMSGG